MGGDEAEYGQVGDMTHCPARSDPVAKPSPPHIELIIPALDVEVLTTTVKYTGLSSALIPVESISRTCKTSIISITPNFQIEKGELTKAPFAAESRNPLAIIALRCLLLKFFRFTTAPSPALFSCNTNNPNARTEASSRPQTVGEDHGMR
jgi:hypothetical protein